MELGALFEDDALSSSSSSSSSSVSDESSSDSCYTFSRCHERLLSQCVSGSWPNFSSRSNDELSQWQHCVASVFLDNSDSSVAMVTQCGDIDDQKTLSTHTADQNISSGVVCVDQFESGRSLQSDRSKSSQSEEDSTLLKCDPEDVEGTVSIPTDNLQLERFLRLSFSRQRRILSDRTSALLVSDRLLLALMTSYLDSVTSQVAAVWLETVFLQKLLMSNETVSRELRQSLLIMCVTHGQCVCDSLLLALVVTHDTPLPPDLRSSLLNDLHGSQGHYMIMCMCRAEMNDSVVLWLLQLLPLVEVTRQMSAAVANSCCRAGGHQLSSVTFSRLLICVSRVCGAHLEIDHVGALQSLVACLKTALARAVQSAYRRLTDATIDATTDATIKSLNRV